MSSRVCASVRQTEIPGWVYVSVRVVVWEAVIWRMGVFVKADRMRIVSILVPSIQPINHINVCDTVYFTAHFYNQYYYI